MTKTQNFNPVEELITLFNKTDDDSLKVEICSILMEYIYKHLQEE